MFFTNPLNTPNYFQNNNLFKDAPKNLGLINYGMPTSDYLNTSEKKQSRFADFFNNIGGVTGALTLTGAIGGLGGLIVGGINASEQNKRAKESMQMARDQYQRENERYELREKERLNNNEQINNIAKKYSSVMTRL
ncbi:hypothetical protein [Helicobacter phage FrGC43A]|uniref:hypothetical protein n=1 Tax=Helicobacter pylori TaxID=210 RepID=UPI000983A148|nr:hypothetical protein [Helicobacter pylori]ANT42874.1 hypothetical protein [Helicobacter phage FrGC43A]PUD75349.1 hypothetical protein C2R64_05385 [Helicobacter pylori]WRG94649.1 hypothetical protein FNE14_03220 [Helicobacter pylori]